MPPPSPSSVRLTEPAPESFSGFGLFYQATLAPLRRYLASILRNKHEAQDIAHDAYLKTYQAMNAKPVDQPQAYLFTTARHLAIRHQTRRANRMVPTDPDVVADQAGLTTGLVDDVVAREKTRAFDAAVLALPPGCRQVLILQIKHGLSHAEIAQRLDISTSTVAKHLARALRLLRDHVPADERAAAEDKSASA